jgi:release factor glutamine methyltransferase
VEERIRFLRADVLDGIAAASQDVIVSNAPYVSSAALEALASEVRDHEPRVALDGGPEGLHVIRKITACAFQALKSGGRLFMEIGADQGDAIREMLDEGGFVDARVGRDLAGLMRFAEGRKR